MRQLSRSRTTRVVTVAAAVIPAAFIALLILKYSVNIPQWDEWAGVTFLDKLNAGTLSLSDLFQQQNEYRQFFPNLIFAFLGNATNFDVRYHMALSFLLACLVSFNIYRLGNLTLNTVSGRVWAYLAANLTIFSPVQYENWLQGQQLIYFFPIACLTTSLVIACSRLSIATKYLICGGLSSISTFSSVNGILCWLLVLPVLLWWNRKPLTAHGWIVAWMAGFLLCGVVYMYGFRHPDRQSLFYIFANPAAAAAYLLSLLGRPLAVHRVWISMTVGACLIVLSVWILLRLKSRPDREYARAQSVWLVLGGYSILTALMIGFGRSSTGLEQSLAPRYTTFTLYLVVALVYLFTMAAEQKKNATVFPPKAILNWAPSIAFIVILAQMPLYFLGVRSMSIYRRTSLQAKACLLLVNVLDDPCITEKVFTDVAVFGPLVNAADRLSLVRPPLLKSADIDQISESRDPLAPAGNLFAELTKAGPHEYVATGWAVNPETGEAPAAVLLAYDRAQSDEVIFAVAFPETATPLFELLRHRSLSAPNWQKRFRWTGAHAGTMRITAWGFDAESRKAYRLMGEHIIQNADSHNVQQK